MKASELVDRLQSMIFHNGDLEVLVETPTEVLPLRDTVDRDKFEENGPHYLVLETMNYED